MFNLLHSWVSEFSFHVEFGHENHIFIQICGNLTAGTTGTTGTTGTLRRKHVCAVEFLYSATEVWGRQPKIEPCLLCYGSFKYRHASSARLSRFGGADVNTLDESL